MKNPTHPVQRISQKGRRKALGQHFLNDRGILRRIVDVIDPKPEDVIVEIGAGKGALTFPLVEKKADIVAIEKDQSLVPLLEKQAFPNLRVLPADVLKVDFPDLLGEKKAKIVGNLPYVISSPLLFKVLQDKDLFTSCVFLLQKEFAQRLCAGPGTKNYAPLSILFQNDFITRLHFRVPAKAFSPPPKVESALVSLKKRPQPLFTVPHQEDFHRFLKRSFQNRRKKLANNLKMIEIPSARIKKAFDNGGIDENSRPEQISLAQFVALYTFFNENR